MIGGSVGIRRREVVLFQSALGNGRRNISVYKYFMSVSVSWKAF
jgi:hypothetical protein